MRLLAGVDSLLEGHAFSALRVCEKLATSQNLTIEQATVNSAKLS